MKSNINFDEEAEKDIKKLNDIFTNTIRKAVIAEKEIDKKISQGLKKTEVSRKERIDIPLEVIMATKRLVENWPEIQILNVMFWKKIFNQDVEKFDVNEIIDARKKLTHTCIELNELIMSLSSSEKLDIYDNLSSFINIVSRYSEDSEQARKANEDLGTLRKYSLKLQIKRGKKIEKQKETLVGLIEASSICQEIFLIMSKWLMMAEEEYYQRVVSTLPVEQKKEKKYFLERWSGSINKIAPLIENLTKIFNQLVLRY